MLGRAFIRESRPTPQGLGLSARCCLGLSWGPGEGCPAYLPPQLAPARAAPPISGTQPRACPCLRLSQAPRELPGPLGWWAFSASAGLSAPAPAAPLLCLPLQSERREMLVPAFVK